MIHSSGSGHPTMNDEQVKISRLISKVLRHRPDSIGIKIDRSGWVAVDELLQKFAQSGTPISHEELLFIVEHNDKKRFVLSPDHRQIRAAQGHSVSVDLKLPTRKPPAVLYHGTVTKSLSSIRKQGLQPGHRLDVHLSADKETAIAVGARRGQPILLVIDSHRMVQDGYKFRRSDNGVWLIPHVPPQYIDFPDDSPT
jgi:putative RNA 2'-phosphotransferase